jgi:hypothetical protein
LHVFIFPSKTKETATNTKHKTHQQPTAQQQHPPTTNNNIHHPQTAIHPLQQKAAASIAHSTILVSIFNSINAPINQTIMSDLGAQLSQLSPEQRQAIMMRAKQEADQQIMTEMMKRMTGACFDKCAGTSVRSCKYKCNRTMVLYSHLYLHRVG